MGGPDDLIKGPHSGGALGGNPMLRMLLPLVASMLMSGTLPDDDELDRRFGRLHELKGAQA